MLLIFYPQSNLKNQVVLKKEMIEQIVILEVGPYRPGEVIIEIRINFLHDAVQSISGWCHYKGLSINYDQGFYYQY